MRIVAALVPVAVIVSMMVAAYLVIVTFENHVPLVTQQAIAQQMPFMSMPTGGNLVLSFGSFLLATTIASLAVFVPLALLSRRD